MTMSDPIADMITRIRNGQRAQKSSVSTPASKMRRAILDVLQKEGYIRGFTSGESADGKPTFEVELKYSEGKPVIVEIQRVSRHRGQRSAPAFCFSLWRFFWPFHSLYFCVLHYKG